MVSAGNRASLKGIWARADAICDMRQGKAHHDQPSTRLPNKGDRVELLRTRTGIRLRGTVFYADHLQILVKWDDGRSQSLKPGVDRYRIIE